MGFQKIVVARVVALSDAWYTQPEAGLDEAIAIPSIPPSEWQPATGQLQSRQIVSTSDPIDAISRSSSTRPQQSGTTL